MQSSDSPILLMAPHRAYILELSVILPVCGSTSATLNWIEAWSLAWMILLLAEHFLGQYKSTVSPASFSMFKTCKVVEVCFRQGTLSKRNHKTCTTTERNHKTCTTDDYSVFRGGDFSIPCGSANCDVAVALLQCEKMADVSDSVVSNNVNNSNGTGAVDDAKAPENETDKVTAPLLLEDYGDLGLEPGSLRNLLSSLRRDSPAFTTSDLIVGLIYVLFLESGFVPMDDPTDYDSCDYDRQRVEELAGAASPSEWRRGQSHCYQFRLVLPPFRSCTVQVVCNFNGDTTLLNCAVDRTEDATSTLLLNTYSYFTKYSVVYTEGTLQDLRGLSRTVKGGACYPVKQHVFKTYDVLECCLEALPPELLCHVMSYLGASDLARLGRTCRYLYKVTSTPRLWLTRLAVDFGVKEDSNSSSEDPRQKYARTYRARKGSSRTHIRRTLRSFDQFDHTFYM